MVVVVVLAWVPAEVVEGAPLEEEVAGVAP